LGVRFQYAEEQAPAAAEKATQLDAAQFEAQLGRLPSALIQELLGAVERLNKPHCLEVAGRIGEIDHALGERLRNMTENRQYKELLAVLDRLTGRGSHDAVSVDAFPEDILIVDDTPEISTCWRAC